MLTVPVSTASVERSFSKLKLIKTYLRSTMSQERLSALSVLSIEAEIAASVSYDIILKKCRVGHGVLFSVGTIRISRGLFLRKGGISRRQNRMVGGSGSVSERSPVEEKLEEKKLSRVQLKLSQLLQ
ncbi:hypothetical protein TNCV_2828621 [Trichonephila clavipes]|nr:hypothetical protein TNCV_2828621 [Trichonephila clavipes]